MSKCPVTNKTADKSDQCFRRVSGSRRFFVGFLALACVLLPASAGLADEEGDRRAQRYEDLSLFTSVLEMVRSNYVEIGRACAVDGCDARDS